MMMSVMGVDCLRFPRLSPKHTITQTLSTMTSLMSINMTWWMLMTFDPSTLPLMCIHMTWWMLMTSDPSIHPLTCINMTWWMLMTFYPSFSLFIWYSPKALSLAAVRFERESFWGFGTRGRGPGNHGYISSSCCLRRCFWTALASSNPRGQSQLEGLCLSDSPMRGTHMLVSRPNGPEKRNVSYIVTTNYILLIDHGLKTKDIHELINS